MAATAAARPSRLAGTPPPPRKPLPPRKQPAKAWWSKQFYLWHWVSGAISLAAMILFAFTGITLNHADEIPATPQVTERTATLPAELLATIAPGDDEADSVKQPLPAALRHWLDTELGVYVGGRSFEWSPEDIYIDLPRPGGDGWMTIDRESGDIVHEVTLRGWISYLNDLHKGRNTGTEWAWFMDVFSVACVIFSLTGLALLFVHARRRPSTWPIVIGGIVLPVLILLIFVHS
ncbi:hypothetical protein AXK11_08090 [Cephaloticoccus primus]|uniref:Peptidase n=1 Tax=Cephaloticoccus primus TaxID=1548207 RepID=A0A139SJC4_9BACT|nr:hypothetical protein AXK11_08090 [Cephaloticoccus primus]